MGLVRNAWVRPSGGLRLCDLEWHRRSDGLRAGHLQDGLRALAQLAADLEASTQQARAFVHPADSQAGTVGAQDREAPVRRLTDADLAELDRIIRELDPTLAPDATLPQTVRP